MFFVSGCFTCRNLRSYECPMAAENVQAAEHLQGRRTRNSHGFASPCQSLFRSISRTKQNLHRLVSVWRFQSKILGVTRSARNPTQHPLGASKPVTTIAARGPNSEENIRQKLLTRTSIFTRLLRKSHKINRRTF